MKCFVLAGGSGDRLWPLSRKNYPKQFMQFKDNRSMFQETIARNLPLCDEFFIITSEKYRYIAEGQLQSFQGIKYRLIFEEVALKTAPAVLFSAMLCDKDDELLIVATDHIIEGGNYNDYILRAKEVVSQNQIAILGVPAKEALEGYGYVRSNNQGVVVDFKENATLKLAQHFARVGGYYWDAGIILSKTGVLVSEFADQRRELYCKTRDLIAEVDVTSPMIVLQYDMQSKLSPISFGEAIISRSQNVRLVPADFYWNKIIDIKSFYAYIGKKFDNRFISHNSKNISIINRANDKLVVANGVKDLYVVNTEDAVYITNEKNVAEIKSIVKEHYVGNERFFEENKLCYQDWGVKEYLTKAEGYSIKKMTIYPGKVIPAHTHENRSNHLTIVKGVATIQIKGKGEREYVADSGVLIPCGALHQIANKSGEDVVIIESSVIQKSVTEEENQYATEGEKIVHLTPIFKDYLWGGTQIRDKFGKKCSVEPIAESWELSCHNAGQSIVTTGKYMGLAFGDYLKAIGKEKLGWKCQPFDAFPLMIKFIDAKEALSIQVHPKDEYALSVEKEYGKNELWYIMDCEPNSYLYIGFKKNVSEEEVRRRIQEHTLTDILNQVPVKKGETYFLPAGTVHAIGTGIFICEVQQSSNATYRLYDYGRKDKDGKERQLHIEKALDVLERSKTKVMPSNYPIKRENGNTIQLIGGCKYFEVKKYTVSERANLIVGSESFLSLIFLEGEGTVQAEQEVLPFKAGDSFFVPAGVKSIQVIGKCEFLTTRI